MVLALVRFVDVVQLPDEGVVVGPVHTLFFLVVFEVFFVEVQGQAISVRFPLPESLFLQVDKFDELRNFLALSGVLAVFTHTKYVLTILRDFLLFVFVVLDLVHKLLLNIERQLLKVGILLFEGLKLRGVQVSGWLLWLLLWFGLVLGRSYHFVRIVVDGQLLEVCVLVEKTCFLEVYRVLDLSVGHDVSFDGVLEHLLTEVDLAELWASTHNLHSLEQLIQVGGHLAVLVNLNRAVDI